MGPVGFPRLTGELLVCMRDSYETAAVYLLHKVMLLTATVLAFVLPLLPVLYWNSLRMLGCRIAASIIASCRHRQYCCLRHPESAGPGRQGVVGGGIVQPTHNPQEGPRVFQQQPPSPCLDARRPGALMHPLAAVPGPQSAGAPGPPLVPHPPGLAATSAP